MPNTAYDIIFTVTNDLSYDQRMQRICTSLSANGYQVLLVGRSLPTSIPLINQSFHQKRISCFFKKGIGFYTEYNIRLLWFYLFAKTKVYGAIDLDTILPNLFASKLFGKKRMYDAHELFTEQKEIVTRNLVHRCWLMIEKYAVPKFKHGYTVNNFIKELEKNR